MTMRNIVFIIVAASLTSVSALMSNSASADDHHQDIVDVAAASDDFTTLVAAVKAAGLVEILQGEGPFTVFAPTDKAFDQLPDGTLESLLRPENKDQLAAILTFHVVPGRITSDDLLATPSAKTVNGARVPFGLSIGSATVIKADIEASNGIIHVIDEVLLPADLSALMTPSSLIELAIQRGAPLYNHGQKAACAAVYEVAAQALIMDDRVPLNAKRALRRSVEKMRDTHSAERQAWIMRDGLDSAYAMMAEAQ
ncbi:MAG: fasciclin domain-containing protein [Rhodothermales bacterium]|nr:fasciclin domain-containing protein [Rhodothermales bacterium]